MTSPHHFQTRLTLAFILAIAAVSGAVLWITGRIVVHHEYRQFTEQFHAQVDYILLNREQRSQGILAQAREFSTHPHLIQALQSDPGPADLNALAQSFWESTSPSRPPRQAPADPSPSSILLQAAMSRAPDTIPVLALVRLDGEVISLFPPKANVSRMGRRKLPLASQLRDRDLASILQDHPQQITYVSVQPHEGPEMAQEVIVTAVHAPQNHALLGAILVGVPAETGAERLLERFHQSVTGSTTLKSGIFLDGQVFARTISKEHLPSLAHVLEEKIRQSQASPSPSGRTASPPLSGDFVVKIGGEPHRIHFHALNPDSSLPLAWHLAAFPLLKIQSELRDIYQKGLAIALLALILAFVAATLLSRQLSIPIRQLSTATHAIRQGDLEARVPVRGQDELAGLARSFNSMADELRQKERYREILEKVSDEAVAQAMIQGTLNVRLGGELKIVTILFCDIRGFSSFSEHLPPDQLIHLLNRHMTLMTEIIRECHGVVDKFIGDEVMAVFGALKSYDNDAANAARAALRIIEARQSGNSSQDLPFHVGIGIATGQVVAGCMGSNDRLNYTVLGSRVNLAARLCDLAGPGQIVIDDATHATLNAQSFPTQALPPVPLKGFTLPVQAYHLEAPHPASLAAATRKAAPVTRRHSCE